MADGLFHSLPSREWRRLLLAVVVLAGVVGFVLVGFRSLAGTVEDVPYWQPLVQALVLIAAGFVPAGYLLVKQGRRLAELRAKLSNSLDERQRTDMALREGEARLRDVLEGAVFGIMIHRDLRPLFVNMAMVRALGYDSKEELMAVGSALKLIAPEEHDRVRKYFSARVREEPAPESYETRAVTKSGEQIFVELGVRPIMWGGEPVVFVTASDITERKRAERALRQSESRLNLAQSIAHLGNWEWRFEDDVLWWSDEVYRIFGLEPGARVPTYEAFLGFVHPDDRGEVDTMVRDARTGGATYGIDHRIVLPDGAVRYVHEQGELVYDAAGRAVSMVGTVHDITQRKQAERLLVESEARHRAFAADVAHELRTPLSVMRANLDNLGDAPALRSLRHDVDVMAHLVEQLLAASRAEMLSIDADDQADLHEVCVTVAARLAPLAIKKGRTIEVTGREGPLLVRGETEALRQAVRNLVDNAIKYSDPGTAVTLHLADDPPTISVLDRGKTIPEEMRDAIFSRFIRADQRSGGVGLGLSIVKRIVDAHGAKVEVVAPPGGGGAQFTIRFPNVHRRKVAGGANTTRAL